MANCENYCCGDQFLLNSNFVLLMPDKSDFEDFNGNQDFLPTDCPYAVFGCKQQFVTDPHIKNCTYRPMECFQTNITKCGGAEVDFELHSILTHLMTVHNVRVEKHFDDFSPSLEWASVYLSQERIQIHCPSTVMECVFKYKGKYFFKNSNVENGIRYWWFSILGTDEQAKKYRACLRIKKLYGGKQNVRVPQWVVPVVSFRKSFPEVFQSKKFASFKLSLKSLEPYSTCHNISDISSNLVPKNATKPYTWCTEVEILTS